MATLDLFDLLGSVEETGGVVDAQREYSAALRQLRQLLPANVADFLWLAVLQVDAAHGAVMVEIARAAFVAGGGVLSEVEV